MAKPKFNFKDEENLIRIQGWARDGDTDKTIASRLGYNETYFSGLKSTIPELYDALKKGRAPLDFAIENKLLKRASGMTIQTQQAFKFKDLSYDAEGNRIESERVEVVTLQQEVPPDTTAMIFWLKNRKPEQWADKSKTDITTNGKAINDIQVEIIDKREQVENTDDKGIQ